MKLKILLGLLSLLFLTGLITYKRLEYRDKLTLSLVKYKELLTQVTPEQIKSINIPQRVKQMTLSMVIREESLTKQFMACQPYVAAAYTTTLKKWHELTQDSEFLKCRQTLIPLLNTHFTERFRQECRSLCAEEFSFYWRSLILDQAIALKNLNTLDPGTLYYLINAKLLRPTTLTRAQRVADLTEVLIKKEPTFWPAYKSFVFSHVLMDLVHKKNIPWLQQLMVMVRQLAPEDPELFELDIIVDYMKDKNKLKMIKKIQQFRQNNPQLGNADYLLAYYYWKEGDLSKTKTSLQKAIKTEPLARYKKTWKALFEKKESKKTLFDIRLAITSHHYR